MSAEGQAARTRTRVIVWVALVALGALFLIDRRATPLALLLSVLGGHAIGLLARYVAGTENPRVPARRMVEALARVGVERAPVPPAVARSRTWVVASSSQTIDGPSVWRRSSTPTDAPVSSSRS